MAGLNYFSQAAAKSWTCSQRVAFGCCAALLMRCLCLLALALAVLGALPAQAQSCPYNLVITKTDGSKDCFTNLPIANEVDPQHKDVLSKIVGNASRYFLAYSKTPACKAVAVTSNWVMLSGFDLNAKAQALSNCQSQGCECELAIDSGMVLSRSVEMPNVAVAQKLADEARNRAADEARRAQDQRTSQELTLAAERLKVEADERARLLALSLDRERKSALAEQARQALALVEQQRAEEGRQADVQRLAAERAQADERARLLLAQSRQSAQEAEAAKSELARARQQLAEAQAAQLAQAATQAAQATQVAAQAAAAEKPRVAVNTARRKALVIGNDSYGQVGKLETARADAKSVGKTLKDLGFDVSLHLDLNERAMKAALRAFKAKTLGGDEVVFFFAGHGVEFGGSNYLLPTDIRSEGEDQVKDESIQLQRVLDDMREKRVGFMLAVVDACRDNPFKDIGRAFGSRGLAATTASSGQMIVYSAGAGEKAMDKLAPTDRDPNGVFTRVFLKEMVKPGIPVDRVLRNVRSEVVRLAKSVGREQTPALYDQAVGDFFFRP